MLPTGFPAITTPGDIAAAALGFVLGFAIDVAFSFTASPATTAGVAAVGCLGIKYFVQARTDVNAEKEERRALEERKNFLVRHFLYDGRDANTRSDRMKLDAVYALWKRGSAANEELRTTLEELEDKNRNMYREEGEDEAHWHLKPGEMAVFERSGLLVRMVERVETDRELTEGTAEKLRQLEEELKQADPKDSLGDFDFFTATLVIRNDSRQDIEIQEKENFAARIIEGDAQPKARGEPTVTIITSPLVQLRERVAREVEFSGGDPYVDVGSVRTFVPSPLPQFMLHPGETRKLEVLFVAPETPKTHRRTRQGFSVEFSPMGRRDLRSRDMRWEEGPIAQWDLSIPAQ